MPKNDQKYREAVERNLGMHERIVRQGKPFHYKDLSIQEIRHKFGIRANDELYDNRIARLLQ